MKESPNHIIPAKVKKSAMSRPGSIYRNNIEEPASNNNEVEGQENMDGMDSSRNKTINFTSFKQTEGAEKQLTI